MSLNIVGKSPYRKDGYGKVTGSTQYIDDLTFEDCLYGKVVRSKIAHGRIKNITFDPQLNWEEFVIVTPKDIPGENIVSSLVLDQPFLAEKEVRYRGEPVILIAHSNQSILEKAAELIHIEYEELPSIFTINESLQKKDVQYGEDNILKHFHFGKGNVDDVFPNAEVIVEGNFSTGAQEHAYIEPQGMTAVASPEKGVTVWGSLQCPYFVDQGLQKLFNLPKEKIRIVFSYTGGAFGGKEEYPTNLAGYVALLSWKANGKPVKIIYSREEDLLVTTKRHPSQTYIKAAFTKDGKMIGLKVETVFDGGAYITLSPVVLSRGVLHSFGAYNCPNVDVDGKAVFTNTPPYGAFRGFGAPQTIFALEILMDQAAKKLDLKPYEVREINVLQKGDTMATGQEMTSPPNLEMILDEALEKSNFKKKQKEYKEFNAKNKDLKKGIGLSLFFHGSGFTGNGEVFLSSQIGIRVKADGTVEILTAQTEIGQGAFTTLSQIVAQELSIPLEDVLHVNPDTAKVPNSGPTVASRTCMVIGNLLSRASQNILEKLRKEAGLPHTHTKEDFKNAVKKYLGEKEDFVVYEVYKKPEEIEWNDETYQGSAYGAYAWACYVADIEVDMITYQAEVKDFIAVQDIGKAIHQIIAEGQIEGGVAQAIGWALYENVIMEDGIMKNHQLTNYIIPTAADIPSIKVFFFEKPYKHGPFGAKGIGELPMDGPAPAIANALSFAIEKDIYSLPMLPEKIMEIVEG